MTDKVLNEKELADALGLSSWTVRRARLEEGMPCFKIGQRIFYRLQTVLSWIATREAGGGAVEPTSTVAKLRVIK